MAYEVKAILLAVFHLGKVKKDTVEFCTIAGIGHKVQRSGHKVQRSGHKVQRSGHKVQRPGPASTLVGTGCSNNMQLQPPPPPTMQI